MAAAKHRAMTSAEHSRHSARVVATSANRAGSPNVTTDAPAAQALSRSNSAAHYASKRRRRSTTGIIRGALLALLAVLVVGGIWGWTYINRINQKLSSGVNQDLLSILAESENPGEPFYMLLLGVDKSEQRAETDGEEYYNYRADTIILARIDPRNVKVTLVSIPRDTYVDMGENGAGKINGAYSIGGPSYMVEVVQEFAGVPISHYAEIDFDAFVAIVDYIGGVDITLPVAISDPEYTGIELSAGEHHLNGWDALMLCRSRHAYDDYGGGDFFRAANQRMVISAIARKVLSSDIMTMSGTISTLADYVTTDMDVASIITLGAQMRSINIDTDFYSGQEPTISEYYDEVWYELCDTEAWQTMMQRVDAGLPPYESAEDDFTAGIAGSIGSQGTQTETETQVVTAEVAPDYSGTVSVLNGSGIDGIASLTAANLSSYGFDTSFDNAPEMRDSTVIVYNGDDAIAKARAVADVLGGNPICVANDGTYPLDANVVVILGADREGY